MLARVSVADQCFSPGVQILLGVADALGERRRRGLVENLHAHPWPFGHLDAVQARIFVLAAGADRPDLAGRQRVAADAVLALQFRRDDELLDAVLCRACS